MAADRHFEKKENLHNSAAIWEIFTKFSMLMAMEQPATSHYVTFVLQSKCMMAAGRQFEKRKIAKTRQLFETSSQSQIFLTKPQMLFIKKLQAIYLMLYKRWYKTAKNKKKL